MYLYIPKREHLYSAEAGSYISYGINVFHEKDQYSTPIASISDVSIDFDSVSNLCKLCTKMQLEPIHLWDVAEDFIA